MINVVERSRRGGVAASASCKARFFKAGHSMLGELMQGFGVCLPMRCLDTTRKRIIGKDSMGAD